MIHARDRVRAVHRVLLLRGGRDEDLARELADALVELENGARGGAYTLRSVSAGDELEVELARLVSALPLEMRAVLLRCVLEVDGAAALSREIDRQRELAELAATRAFR